MSTRAWGSALILVALTVAVLVLWLTLHAGSR